MTDEPEESFAAGALAPRAKRSSSLRAVATATVIVALAGYLIVFIAFRSLGAAGYTQFAVFWSALYLVAGAIFGIQQETTRSVRVSQETGSAQGVHALQVGLTIGAGIAVLVAASSPLWSTSTLGTDSALFVVLLVIGALLYAGHSTMAGALAGLDRWNGYAVLLVTESLVRLGALALVASIGLGVAWLAIVSAGAMGSWLIFFLIPGFRVAAVQRLDSRFGAGLSQAFLSVLAAAASAILVTGFPVILRAVAGDIDASVLGVAILVVTLTRAPIMLPLNAFLGMIVASFVDNRASGLKTVLRSMGLVALGGVALAALATAIGHPLLLWLFGDSADAPALFIGGCTFAASMIGVLSIGGAATLARSKHLGYVLGWLAAAAIAWMVLYIPLEIHLRIVVALVAGPLVGVVIHLGVLIDARRTEDSFKPTPVS